MFRKAFFHEPIPIPRAVVDSAVEERRRRSQLTVPTPAMISQLRDAIPATYPPAERIIVGTNHKIWVSLRATSGERSWLALDPEGEPRGRIVLPSGARLVAADDSYLWIVETDEFDVPSVVCLRYGRM